MRDGRLRHPSFQGLRADKDPREVVLEKPAKEVAESGPASKRTAKRAAPALADVASGDTIAGVKISNPDKVLYPDAGFTKGEVIDYYARIAPALIPHLEGRLPAPGELAAADACDRAIRPRATDAPHRRHERRFP